MCVSMCVCMTEREQADQDSARGSLSLPLIYLLFSKHDRRKQINVKIKIQCWTYSLSLSSTHSLTHSFRHTLNKYLSTRMNAHTRTNTYTSKETHSAPCMDGITFLIRFILEIPTKLGAGQSGSVRCVLHDVHIVRI